MRVRDFDAQDKQTPYVVKLFGSGRPAKVVYSRQTGTDAEYYRVYNKKILRTVNDGKRLIFFV